MSLATVQELFVCAVHPDRDASAESAAARHIISSGTLDARSRLDIYRKNISGAHVNALKQVYPVCCRILGERVFSQFACDYAWSTPSDSPDLNRYGGDFPDYLDHKTRPLDTFAGYDYLHDLALLEWHWHAACYQPDDSGFDYTGFRQCNRHAERLAFELSNSLSIMATDYPVLEILERHRKEADTAAVTGLTGTEHLCIHRVHSEPVITRIDVSTYRVLKYCRQNRTLSEIAMDPDCSPAVGKLPDLVARGWITGFHLLDHDPTGSRPDADR